MVYINIELLSLKILVVSIILDVLILQEILPKNVTFHFMNSMKSLHALKHHGHNIVNMLGIIYKVAVVQ